VNITWRAFELRPKGAPPLPPEYHARIEAGRPRFAAMAREQYGLEINPGPFGIDSRPALIGEQYAKERGLGEAYHRAVAEAYWQHAQRIDDPHMLAEIAAAAGIEREAFLAALGSADLAAAVDADIAEARANDTTGVPALVFDDKYLVMGAQPYPVLEQVVQHCETEADGYSKEQNH